MAQLVVKRGPAAAATKRENVLLDWNTLLHSLHLQKMALDPELFDDATVPHNQGTCPCRCTGNLYLNGGT
jgi:hypothetical protein